MMAAENPLINTESLLALKAAYLRHTRAGSAARLLALSASTLGLCGLLGVVGAVEWHLYFEMFTLIKGPAVPGDEATFNVPLLATLGLLSMIAFHLYAHENANAAVTIRRATGVLLCIYMFGAFSGVTSAIYFGGADALMNQVGTASADLFAVPAAEASSSSLEGVVAIFPAFFSCACGTLVVTSLFVADRLVTAVLANARKILKRWQAGREAIAAMRVIRASMARHVELCQQRDALALEQATFEVSAVHDVLMTISDAVAPYETHLTHAAMASGGENNPWALPISNLDRKSMAARVAALRGVSFKTVLAALRGAKE